MGGLGRRCRSEQVSSVSVLVCGSGEVALAAAIVHGDAVGVLGAAVVLAAVLARGDAVGAHDAGVALAAALAVALARCDAVGAHDADVALAVAWARDEAVKTLRADVALAACLAREDAVGALAVAWARGEAVEALCAGVALAASLARDDAVGALATVPWVGTVGDPPQRSALSLCWMEDYFWIEFVCHCMRVHVAQVLPLDGRRWARGARSLAGWRGARGTCCSACPWLDCTRWAYGACSRAD